MQKFIFDLNISIDELKKFYQGAAQNVRARAHNGQIVQFPAQVLRQFVTQDGVVGVFEVTHHQGKLVEIKRREGS